MKRPSVVIVSPAAPGANNGNARTAERWAGMLGAHYAVRLATNWPDDAGPADLLVALHARRSAPAVDAWHRAHPERPLVLVLTGTDLYQDIGVDEDAQRSLALADALVVLQDQGPDALPPALRAKVTVIYQSTPSLPPVPKESHGLEAVAVGHLRRVKAPETVFEAARLLRTDEGIRITHIGDAAAEPRLADAARATEQACAGYRWLGALPYDGTRERIRRAHVLVHPSLLEGGAHVIMEAVCSGTPVLASRVPGNVGMLGPDYAGYFEPGDAAGLAALLRECRRSLAERGGLWRRLEAQCAARAALFSPAREQASLLALLGRELAGPGRQ